MRRLATLALSACLSVGLLLSAAPALARDIPPGGLTAGEVAGWLRASGYPAQVKPDPTTPGDQVVSTATDGVNVDIYLYDCSGQSDARRCTSMQYAAGWSPSATYTLDKVNAWNSTKRYIKAYLTPHGSLYGEYDLDLSPGGTYEMLDDTMHNWRDVVVDFQKEFGQ